MGKCVSECIKQLSGKDLDSIVKIAFKRRKYKDKQNQNEMRVHFVALYNDEDKNYHIYNTHLERCFECENIVKLYGARWYKNCCSRS